MSYASGFMVGTSIGKAVYDLFHNKKKGGSAFAGAPSMQGGKAADVPRFACVSALPGRRRYRAASLVGNAGLAEFMEENRCHDRYQFHRGQHRYGQYFGLCSK